MSRTENATGLVVENIRAHGAPNHCSAAGTGNAIVRNAILYNCQDYVWLRSTNNFTFEHLTVPSGIGVEGMGKPLGPIIVRNSIFAGSIAYIRGPVAYCTWEKGSIMENNVISTAATIERCGPTPMTAYPILTYMAKCASGEFTNCMTIRNNRMVDPTAWKTVMKDGMWNATLGDSWDVSLVPNSPAIDAGIVSGATRDILGVSRPKGSAFDIGAYEYCVSGCSRPPPATPAQVRVIK